MHVGELARARATYIERIDGNALDNTLMPLIVLSRKMIDKS